MSYSEPTDSNKIGKIIIISIAVFLVIFVVVMLIIQSRFGEIGNDQPSDLLVEEITN